MSSMVRTISWMEISAAPKDGYGVPACLDRREWPVLCLPRRSSSHKHIQTLFVGRRRVPEDGGPPCAVCHEDNVEGLIDQEAVTGMVQQQTHIIPIPHPTGGRGKGI